jgi:hypothetical protein
LYGKALIPEGPVNLRPNVTYTVTVEEADQADEPHILDQILALATDMGVTDLAGRHDDYARGILKLPDGPEGPSVTASSGGT